MSELSHYLRFAVKDPVMDYDDLWAYCKEAVDEIEKLEQRLAEAEAKLAETEKALRWVCNIYIVDDYCTGDLRKERLERAVRYAMKKGRLKETSGSEGEWWITYYGK